jgi:hypothetical protein
MGPATTGAIAVALGVKTFKIVAHLGVAHGFTQFINQQILLRHIGRVLGLFVFGEQVIKWLVFPGPNILRNGIIPLRRVVEFRVHVENHAPKREDAMFHNLPNGEFGGGKRFHVN